MSNYILVSAFTNINFQNTRTQEIMNRLRGSCLAITTDFDHSKKDYYSKEEMGNPQQIHIHVPRYSKNLSIKRLFSHIVFSKKLYRYLNNLEEKPKAIYCTMPSSSSAFVCAKYCKKNHVKFIIDVIDLWPDSLLPFVKGKMFVKGFLFPWTYLARYAYKNADVILGESKKYAEEAKLYNKKAEIYPLYLGVDMNIIRDIKYNNPVKLEKPSDEVWIAYAGSLGVSYGFDTLLNAIKLIHNKYEYKLWFIGDGVDRKNIESFINVNKLNAEITGFLPYHKLLGYLMYCDIGINMFRPGTKVVYSYKFNDYVATDCYILNSLEGETAEMIDDYRIGTNFNYSDNPLYIAIDNVLSKWDQYSKWKNNNELLIKEKLDKAIIYSVIPEVF